jgi:hypothetical protein
VSERVICNYLYSVALIQFVTIHQTSKQHNFLVLSYRSINTHSLSATMLYKVQKSNEETFKKFTTSIRTLLTQGQMLGIISFTCAESGFKFSKLKTAGNVTASCVLTLVTCYCMYNFAVDPHLKMIMKTTYSIGLVCSGTFFVTTWTSVLVKKDKLVEFLVKIVDFDVKLRSNGLTINYQKYKTKMIRRLLLKYLFVALHLVAYVLMYMENKGYFHYSMVAHGEGIVFMMVSQALSFHLTELVLMLRHRFQLLNGRIEKIVFASESTSFVERTSQNRRLFLTFCKICSLHHHLSKMIKLFNDIYGLTLLLQFSVAFLVMTMMFFYITGFLQADVVPWLQVSNILLLAVLYGIDCFRICDVCYSTVLEVSLKMSRSIDETFPAGDQVGGAHSPNRHRRPRRHRRNRNVFVANRQRERRIQRGWIFSHQLHFGVFGEWDKNLD